MKPVGWNKLRSYQKRAAITLASGRVFGLWVGAGLGKTAMVLASLSLMEVGWPVLVVTKAIGRHAWPRDAAWVLGDLFTFGILREGKQVGGTGYHIDECGNVSYSSLPLLLSENVGVIINYDILTQRGEELSKIHWKAVIFDESHSLKGGFVKPEKTRDYQLIRKRYHWAVDLARLVQKRGGVVWQLTATPVCDRRRDLWAQLDLSVPGPILPKNGIGWNYLRELNERRELMGLPPFFMGQFYETTDGYVSFPGPFGASLVPPEIEIPCGQASSFLRRYCGAEQGTYGLVHDRETLTEELNDRLKLYFIKINRQEVAHELPARQRIVRSVDLDKSHVPRGLQGGGYQTAVARAAYQKIDAALELVQQHVGSGEKIVIAVNMIDLAHRVHKDVSVFAQKKLPPAIRRELIIEVATGEEDANRRKNRVDAFNETTQPGILVVTHQCVSTSINLHKVPVVVFLSLPYTPKDLDQFEGRFARMGGIPVTIYYLVGDGTIDIKIREIILSKLSDVVGLGADTADAEKVSSALDIKEREEDILEAFKEYLENEVGDFEEEE